MRVLVTGGGGFLGRWVANEALKRGLEPVLYDRHYENEPHHAAIVGDICDVDLLADSMSSCTAVFHLAAIADLDDAREHPRQAVDVNVTGTLSVLEAMRASEVERLVHASSVYVHSSQGSVYRTTKRAAEGLVLDLSLIWGFKPTVLRFGSIYGPGADSRNAISRLVKQAIHERRLDYWGDGNEIREYVHVSDAAALALDALSDEYVGASLHISGRERLTSRELLAMICEMLGEQIPVTLQDQPFEGRYRQTPFSLEQTRAKRITAATYTDLGLGILDLLQREMDSQWTS